MWPTSSAFSEALLHDRRLANRVEVLYGGQVQLVLDVVIDGTVTTEDETVRRSSSVRLVDPEGTLTPVTARDLLAPRGTELRIFKGLYLPGLRSPELVPLGTLRIASPAIRRDEGGVVIDLKGYDRARAIQRTRFTAPYSIAAGTPTTTAIAGIITSRSGFPVNVTPSASTTPALVFEQLGDPWDAVQSLARSDALEAFFDVMGTFVCRPVPDYAAQTPVWSYAPGELSLLLHDEREMSDENTYSGVIVTAERPGAAPIRVEVWDTDPASPTYYDPANPAASTFGPVPYGYFSPSISTAAQATAAGQAIRSRVSGLIEQVEIGTAGHFGHDVGDVLAVTDPETRLHGTHIVSRVTQPIRGGPMSLRMRSRRALPA